MSRDSRLPVFVLLLVLSGASAVSALPPGSTPAATLLLPYFEVDSSGPGGITTLFSVNNASHRERVVAHVVVWTDWGIPTYSFDLALEPNDVQTLNLRDLFTSGSVPRTDGSGIPGCADEVANPPLDAAGLAALRARHAGEADPNDGLCYGSERADETSWVGYVTVDTARTCAGEATLYPTDRRYFFAAFGAGPFPGSPFADGENVLWGDVFYVASDDASAQGMELVQIPFDPDAPAGKTFYRTYAPDGEDGRALLGSRYRGRYLVGGAFDGGTDLLVWLEPFGAYRPTTCARGDRTFACEYLSFDLYDEDGTLLSQRAMNVSTQAFRLLVGGDVLPVVAPFGAFELHHELIEACTFIPAGIIPGQAWVTPVMKAEGRFSVGLPVTRIPLPGER